MDAILIGLVGSFAVSGTWKGGIKTILSLLSFVAAFLISCGFYSLLADLLFNAGFLSESLKNCVNDLLSGLNKELTAQKFSSLNDMMMWLEGLDLPYYGKNVLISVLKNISFSGEFTVAQVVSSPLYKIILEVISFVVIFLLSFVLLKILQYFLQKIIRFPFFKVTDRVVGFLVGVGFGVAVYFVVVYFLVLISNVMLSDFLIEKLNEGYLSSIFYKRIVG